MKHIKPRDFSQNLKAINFLFYIFDLFKILQALNIESNKIFDVSNTKYGEFLLALNIYN